MPGFFSSSRRLRLAVLIGISLLQAASTVVAASVISRLFASLQYAAGPDSGDLLLLSLIIGLVGSLEVGKRRTIESLGLDYAMQIRLLLFQRTVSSPRSNLITERRSHGSTLLPFVGDLTALRQWSADGVARGISALLIITSITGYLAIKSTALGVTLLIIELVAVVLMYYCGRLMSTITREQRLRRGALTAFISDRILAYRTVLASGCIKRELASVSKKNRRMNRSAMKRANLSGVIRAIGMSATSLCTLTTLLTSRELVNSGAIATSDVVGILSLVGLIGSSLTDLGRSVELAIPGFVSKEKLRKRLSEHSVVGKKPARVSRVGLVIDRLQQAGIEGHFSDASRQGDVILLEDMDSLARSNLIAVLAGIQEPIGGSLYLHGRKISALPPKRRRDAIGVASLVLPLLKGSLFMNLHYRYRNQSPLSPERLVAEFQEHRLLSSTSELIDLSIAGNNDPDLSEHDYSLFSLIRAMSGSPELLILDNMDKHLEESQVTVLGTLISDWPGIVILSAQSPHLRRLANKVWKFEAEALPAPHPEEATVLRFSGTR